MPISTSDLSGLPSLDAFRRLTKSLAALDAVLDPDWESRYYSFNAAWDVANQRMWASMRNGCGDDWCAVLSPAGAALLGLAHESPTYEPDSPKSWVFSALPTAFHTSLMNEPAADSPNSTFCIWRTVEDTEWHSGLPSGKAVDDGSTELLSILDGTPATYIAYAADYYECELQPDDVRAVYEHRPLTPELARRLNARVDLEQLRMDLDEIGYPDAGSAQG